MHALGNPPEWVDLTQAERLYPYSRRTFWYWIASGAFPVYRPTKRKVLLKRADIDKFLESKRVGSDLDQMVDEVMADLRGGK